MQRFGDWSGVVGGSWVVIRGVISPLIRVITIVTLLITPLITPREPPSKALRIEAQRSHGLQAHF